MRSRLAVLALLGCAATTAAAGPSAAPGLEVDPELEAVVREVRDKSPEVARARAAARAEAQRVPQVGALPDPVLSLGIQNDGFRAIQIGKMESSFWQVMATQPFPWPGKRGAREELARTQARGSEAQRERVELSTTAEVERAWVDLLLVRGQLELQSRLEALWKEAEAVARARYEVGATPQSDLVRAQLERTRLQQQRIGLLVAERQRVQTLNRLRVHPLEEPIATRRGLPDLADPSLPTPEEASADAERRSPDLALAALGAQAAERRVELARRERYPDLSVTAAVMPRGQLEPMWAASVAISLPIFSGRKQSRAVDESLDRRESEDQGAEAIRQVVRLRAQERQALLAASLQTNRIYRGGLLVQSEASVQSTLGQYRVGKVTFASVLEALRGRIADEASYLESLAQAQRIAIAAREVSLDPPGGMGGGLASGAVPGGRGTGGGGAGKAAASSGGAAAPAAESGGGMATGM
jgi:outer membrane protein TolC